MIWRLIIITDFLSKEGIDICFLPGARWPAGAEIPPNVPYQWLGTPSKAWASIGALVSRDIVENIQHVSTLDFERSMWLELTCVNKDSSLNALFCCGFYGAPGGDLETWDRVHQEMKELKVVHPHAEFLLAGDGNAHFKHCVDHEPSCSCPHCKRSAVDRTIEAQVLAAGLMVLNEAKPTHDSGHMIDVILGTVEQGCAHTYDENIGDSDHRMVTITLSSSVQLLSDTRIGRVGWGSLHLWPDLLVSIGPS